MKDHTKSISLSSLDAERYSVVQTSTSQPFLSFWMPPWHLASLQMSCIVWHSPCRQQLQEGGRLTVADSRDQRGVKAEGHGPSVILSIQIPFAGERINIFNWSKLQSHKLESLWFDVCKVTNPPAPKKKIQHATSLTEMFPSRVIVTSQCNFILFFTFSWFCLNCVLAFLCSIDIL